MKLLTIVYCDEPAVNKRGHARFERSRPATGHKVVQIVDMHRLSEQGKLLGAPWALMQIPGQARLLESRSADRSRIALDGLDRV